MKAGGSREPGAEAHAQRATGRARCEHEARDGGDAARRPVRGRASFHARSKSASFSGPYHQKIGGRLEEH